MVDQLDLQILNVISNAPSIVRSVTEMEIESGVLFPSVTTMDIKRNLPYNVDLNIIEGRLRALENDGYIYYEANRWWLTSKGREILGKPSKITLPPTSPSKPMRKILEETFSKFELDMKAPPHAGSYLERIDYFRKRKAQAEALFSELKRSHELDLISESEFQGLMENISKRLRELDTQIEAYVLNRRNELLKEIEILENELGKKRVELENLSKTTSRK